MKKKLFATLAVAALLAAVVPATLAEDNTNAYKQTTYVDDRAIADTVNGQVAAHQAEIAELAEQYVATQKAALKAAQDAKAAFIKSGYSGHDYSDKVAAYDEAIAEAQAAYDSAKASAVQTVTNQWIAKQQATLKAAAIAEGRYWNDASGVNGNKTQEQRIAEDQANQGKAAAKDTVAPTTEEKAKASDAASKAAAAAKDAKATAKTGAKELPKTSAAK